MHENNREADQDDATLRLSIDCKATVKIGEFARQGKSRQKTEALDHDFGGESVVPFGILLPETKESYLYMTTSKATSDFMADCLTECILQKQQENPELKKVVINADNGPENSGSRTQWLKRIIELSDQTGLTIKLAYYPPYHSKYNPVERLWGVLEKHWGGELLTSLEKVVGLASTMTYAGLYPVVKTLQKEYQTGVTVSKEVMTKEIEPRLSRLEGLKKWFIDINPVKF